MASSNTVTIDVVADTTSAIKSINTLSSSIAKTLAGITATVSAAIVAIGKESLESYADYEQLTQSVALIFDDAADSVIASAQNAYSALQTSANDYLEQATNFGELLVNSLGGDTEDAAGYVEMALTDMADIANAYGLELSTVQDVYKSISHGIYTTLDNLNLGYTQGKTSMEQLIADANEYAESIGEAGDLTIDSFADIVQAIDYIVQKNGIAGTSAKEAVETIQGSMNVLSATWENWKLSLATDDLDTSEYTAALIGALENVAANVLPIIEEIAVGLAESLPQAISDAASAIAPLLAESIAAIWNTASALLSEYTSIDVGTIDASNVENAAASIGEVFQGLWDIVEPIVASFVDSVIPAFSGAFQSMKDDLAPVAAWLQETVVPAIIGLLDSITSADVSNIAIFSTVAVALKELMDVIPLASGSGVLSGLISGFTGLSTLLSGGLPTLITSVGTALSVFTADGGFVSALAGIASGASLSNANITSLGIAVKGIGSFFTSAVPTILLAVSALAALALAFTSAYDESDTFREVVDSIPEIVGTALSTAASAIVEYLPQALEALASLLNQLAEYVVENGPAIVTQAMSFLGTVASIFAEYLPSILGAVGEIIGAIIAYIVAEAPNILASAVTLMSAFIEGVGSMASGIISGFIEGVGSFFDEVWEFFSGALDDVLSSIKEFLGIASPSTVFEGLGDDVVQGFINGITGLASSVASAFKTALSSGIAYITSLPSTAISWGKNILSGIANGISAAVSTVTGKLSSLKSSISSFFSGAASWLVSAGKNLLQGLANGITSAVSSVVSTVKNAVNSVINGAKSLLGISSPSKVFAEIGDFTMRGLAEGIEDAASEAVAAVSDVVNDMSAAAQGIATDVSLGFSLDGSALQGVDLSTALAAAGTTINQTFETKVVRSDSDLYTAAPIIYRNALREASLI